MSPCSILGLIHRRNLRSEDDVWFLSERCQQCGNVLDRGRSGDGLGHKVFDGDLALVSGRQSEPVSEKDLSLDLPDPDDSSARRSKPKAPRQGKVADRGKLKIDWNAIRIIALSQGTH